MLTQTQSKKIEFEGETIVIESNTLEILDEENFCLPGDLNVASFEAPKNLPGKFGKYSKKSAMKCAQRLHELVEI